MDILEMPNSDEKYLYFKNRNGIFCRLSNHGGFGWRLQLSENGSFCDNGAAQSLARFMKEELCDPAVQVEVSSLEDKLTLTAEDGTAAVLDIKADTLRFISDSGKCITELINSEFADGKLTLTGSLRDGEAIYGGGERFDAVNKRGNAFELYTSDGWNDVKTTYVVQPLFLTSRGGGMFFNRYEQSVADFGSSTENEWSYTHRGELLDCYFFPTGDVNSAITACTELTGHALMPTPWMQGVQICRYAPDFRSLDVDIRYPDFDAIPDKETLYIGDDDEYSLLSLAPLDEQKKAEVLYQYDDEAEIHKHFCVKDTDGTYRTLGPKRNPGGDSCKRIMESFVKLGAKPDAALMEGRIWEDCFGDTDESRAKKAELRKTVEWLHSNGIKAMVYLRIGRVVAGMSGYSEDYCVHADVEVNYREGRKFFENTTEIPWVVGTGENPDVQVLPTGIRTEKYLDVTNPEALNWYFDTVWGQMIDIGIDGVKIDFCEVFPDDNRTHGITKTRYRWKNPNVFTSGSEHHAYPVFYISAFTKRMNELKKAKGDDSGFMVFSRGGGIGSQRNPYLWEGDQTRTFPKLKDQLAALICSGLSAIPFMSYDMAGYAYKFPMSYFTMTAEEESEIFARAIEFTAFTTNIQTHGDVRHVYELTPQTQEIYKSYLALHYALMPYMQKYSAVACETGVPPVRHLILKYQGDPAVYGIDDEYLFGDALLVAPILTGDTFEREVYLPEGTWKNLLTGELLEGKTTVNVKASLAQIPVFLDMTSADTTELLKIFESDAWDKIKVSVM